MQISRANYIRQRLDDPSLAESIGAEWDEQHAAWQATLPADTEAVRAYLASLGRRREDHDPAQHGSREEVEAAAATWEAEQQAEAERLAEEARVEEAKRAKAAAALAEEAARAREQAAATLEAAAATVQAAVASGKLDTVEVAEAYAAIALAGVARLRG